MDAFIQIMNIKLIQQQLRTEPELEQKQTLRYAVAFQKGITQQKSFARVSEFKVDEAPVMNEKARKSMHEA